MGPYGQRIALADGARPSTSVASNHESRAGSARDRTGRRERNGEMGARVNGEKRKQHAARRIPLPNRKHRKHNHCGRSSSSNGSCSRSDAASVTTVPVFIAIDGGHWVRNCLRGRPMEIEAFERNVLSGFRACSNISKSEVAALIDFATKSVKKLVVEPLPIVDLGLCSAAIYDVSYDSLSLSLSLHCVGVQACERVRLQSDVSWFARAACSYQYVIELVTAILLDLYWYEVYQEDSRDKSRVKVGARIFAARDTMSTIVMLAMKAEESACDVNDYSTISHFLTYSCDELRRAVLSFFLSANWLPDAS